MVQLIKSPLRYPGGKNKIAEQIAFMAPEFTEYREPLVGGGSVYFANRQLYANNSNVLSNDKKYWINDLNYELYNFWDICQQDTDFIINKAIEWRNKYLFQNKDNSNGKELHRYLRQNLNVFNNKELAAAYFTLNRIVFAGGTLVSGVTLQHIDGFKELDIKNHFNGISDILKGTRITNLDYSKVVQADGKDIYIFCDAPYYSATDSGLYGKSDKWRNLHKMFDHQRFANTMKNITETTNHKWLATYDDSPIIRKMFSWANIIEFKLQYGGSKIGNEIFISNFELPKDKQRTIDDSWF